MAPNINGKKAKKHRKKKTQKKSHQDEGDDSDYLALMRQVERTEEAVDMNKIHAILININNSLECRELSRKQREELVWNLRLVHSLCEIYNREFLKLDKSRARLFDRIKKEPDYVKTLMAKGHHLASDAIRIAKAGENPILAVTESIFGDESWESLDGLPKNLSYLTAEFDEHFYNN
jgi:hypothetical protein